MRFNYLVLFPGTGFPAVWAQDIVTGPVNQMAQDLDGWVRGIAISPDGRQLITVSEDSVRLSVPGNRPVVPISRALAFHPVQDDSSVPVAGVSAENQAVNPRRAPVTGRLSRRLAVQKRELIPFG